jgi:transposase
MYQHSVIGLDIAKQVFQAHMVDVETGQIVRLKLRRGQVLGFFAGRVPALVAMEACGSAHWWARQLVALGHAVRLLPPRQVRPFVLRNKTDAADAQAIWTAAQQPGIKSVAVKTPVQQSVLALHRLRAQLLKMRIMQSNALRGLLYEFGEVLPDTVMAPCARRCQPDWLPWMGSCPGCCCNRCASNGRVCRAWTAISPRSSGGSMRCCARTRTVRRSARSPVWGCSRGDAYLRTLLMHAARAVITRGQHSAWLAALLKRRPFNVAVAALAHKLARTIWAVLARGRSYDPTVFAAA